MVDAKIRPTTARRQASPKLPTNVERARQHSGGIEARERYQDGATLLLLLLLLLVLLLLLPLFILPPVPIHFLLAEQQQQQSFSILVASAQQSSVHDRRSTVNLQHPTLKRH